MFSRLFGKPKEEPNTLSTLDKLNEVSALPSCYNRLLIRFSRFFSFCVRSAIIRVSVFLKEFLIFEQRLLDVLQTLEMLEKKEKVLQRKIATEIEKARDFTKAKNKRGMYE
jgi:hypothetical protein